MFTGKLRELAEQKQNLLVEQNSGKIVSNVNKKLELFSH